MLQNTEKLRAFVNFQLNETVQLCSVFPFWFKKAVKRKCSFVALSLSYYWCVRTAYLISYTGFKLFPYKCKIKVN